MTSNLGLIDTPQISGNGEPVPNYSMYDSGAVALATFLGGPIPGSMLMAHNYRRMGESTNALMAILVGVGAMAAAVGIGFAVPQSMSLIISGTLIYGMRQAAESLQGPAVDHHVNQGGKLGSKLAAAGLGLVFLAALLAIILPPLFVSKVTIGTQDEVYYSGTASQEDAQALGDKLKAIGYLTDRGVTVLLSKKADEGTAVSFVVQDGAWDRPELVPVFEQIGREVAPSVGGLPIKVRLANKYKMTKKEIPITVQ